MRDQFRNYDRWKLSNREDEEDTENARLQREEDMMERADEENDRAKDEGHNNGQGIQEGRPSQGKGRCS